jgi:lipoprotein-releasing system permease protein
MASFESFVAWRYLMARERRVSRLALWLLGIGLVVGGTMVALNYVMLRPGNPFGVSLAARVAWSQAFSIGGYVAFALAGLALFFGLLRLWFTFFTVVPLGGVWIGTGALVCVLSVMSGFESDLRQKILGSNAHVQITREDGDFVEWREVKAAVDKLKGVRGSTPFASSEVVIAANNNGMNVIIKGIDPETIGSVTDLVKNLQVDDRLSPAEAAIARQEVMQALYPLVDDELQAPPRRDEPRPDREIDPAPDDLLEGGEPIDFSQPGTPEVAPTPPPPAPRGVAPEADPAAGSPAGASKSAVPGAGDRAAADGADGAAPARGDDFGGDALAVLGDTSGEPEEKKRRGAAPAPAPVKDDDDDLEEIGDNDDGAPAPERPIRLTREGDTRVLTVPMRDSGGSQRTKSLPGVLVGRELEKQTHMYRGQEVRVVSPLSDPANPDATGTPIPFNRDYRVAGIFYTGMYEYDLKQVYVTLDSFQEFLDRGDAVDGIEVRVASPDDAATYVRRISAAVGPAYRVVDWTELNRSLFSALWLEKITMFIVLGIVILVASFSIVGNLIMVVFEKGREIALLKTLGATNWGVMWLFVLRGLMIGTIGTVLGVGMGLSACLLAKRFGIPLNPDVYYIDRLPIHVDASSVVLIALAGVVISGLAALYPALLAIRIRPATGLRH